MKFGERGPVRAPKEEGSGSSLERPVEALEQEKERLRLNVERGGDALASVDDAGIIERIEYPEPTDIAFAAEAVLVLASLEKSRASLPQDASEAKALSYARGIAETLARASIQDGFKEHREGGSVVLDGKMSRDEALRRYEEALADWNEAPERLGRALSRSQWERFILARKTGDPQLDERLRLAREFVDTNRLGLNRFATILQSTEMIEALSARVREDAPLRQVPFHSYRERLEDVGHRHFDPETYEKYSFSLKRQAMIELDLIVKEFLSDIISRYESAT